LFRETPYKIYKLSLAPDFSSWVGIIFHPVSNKFIIQIRIQKIKIATQTRHVQHDLETADHTLAGNEGQQRLTFIVAEIIQIQVGVASDY